METCFNLVDMPIRDMIADQLPIQDIVAVTRFQTCIACDASIESLKIVDFHQHIEDESILTMIYAEAVVNGLTFKILVSTDNDEIVKSALTFSSSVESNNRFMKYVRECMQ